MGVWTRIDYLLRIKNVLKNSLEMVCVIHSIMLRVKFGFSRNEEVHNTSPLVIKYGVELPPKVVCLCEAELRSWLKPLGA
jgi:hypothetical protein